jgi:hypothetical protein
MHLCLRLKRAPSLFRCQPVRCGIGANFGYLIGRKTSGSSRGPSFDVDLPCRNTRLSSSYISCHVAASCFRHHHGASLYPVLRCFSQGRVPRVIDCSSSARSRARRCCAQACIRDHQHGPYCSSRRARVRINIVFYRDNILEKVAVVQAPYSTRAQRHTARYTRSEWRRLVPHCKHNEDVHGAWHTLPTPGRQPQP